MQVNQDLIGKDGTIWQALATSHVQRGRLQEQNIPSFKPGPTAFATSKIMESSPLSSFRVLFDEAMLRNIRKYTAAEANRISDKINWNVELDELDKFVELVICKRDFRTERFSCGKFMGINLRISDVQQHSIKTEIQGNDAILALRPEER